MKPELVERGDRLIVSAPYNHRWLLWASANGAYRNAGSRNWMFHVEQREAVEEALREIFGEGE